MRSDVRTHLIGAPLERLFSFALLLALAIPPFARAQEKTPAPRLSSFAPMGKAFMTKTYGTLGFNLSNPGDRDLAARVLTFYDGAASTQYGRDLWMPPHASLWSWFTVGPPDVMTMRNSVEIKSLLLDRSNKEQHLLRSDLDQPLGTSLIPFERNDQMTSLMIDTDISDGSQGTYTQTDILHADELRELIFALRHEVGQSPRLNVVRRRFLPPIAEAFEGIDQFVLASNRITADPDGKHALREWLERGGRLWIPLDLVQQETVASLLGDILNVQILDRTSLTSVRVEKGPGNPYVLVPETVEFEKPVDFVRVLAPQQQVFYTVNDWPAAFLTEVGRGRVLFTTLGARAWTRERQAKDPPSNYQDFPTVPVALVPLQFLGQEILMKQEKPLFSTDDLKPFVTSQIGYQVVSRGMVLLVFGLLFLGMVLASFVLIKKGGLEHLGWLGPALAFATAGAFFVLGEHSRSAVPPTIAVAQIVDAEPGTDDAQATGLMAVYQPGLEPATVIGAKNGGQFELDTTGLEGRVHSRMQTDVNSWQWDNLELPVGVRLAPFKYTIPVHEPMSATVRFGPQGMEGRVASGPFRPLEDALLTYPGQHAMPVSVGQDGVLQATGDESLHTGQLMTSGLLSDRQRARQNLYEKLTTTQSRLLASRSFLLAWSDPVDMHFTLVDKARTTGMALVAIPIQFERTLPNTPVLVPPTFVECQKVGPDGRLGPPTLEARYKSSVKLRFQVPSAVRPLTIESARLAIKLQAPLRETVVSGFAGQEAVVLQRLASSTGVERIEITDPRLLQVDDQGALYVNIEVGNVRNDVERDLWHLDWATLEIRGKTHEQGRGEHESR